MEYMTREQAKELAPIIKHFGDGGKVQFFKLPSGIGHNASSPSWHLASSPSWNSDLKYRIKPEPLVYERWVVVVGDIVSTFKNETLANRYGERMDNVIARLHIRREYEEGEGL